MTLCTVFSDFSKLTTLAITALMATTLVSTQNVLAASKKAQKKANKAYAQAIKKNKVAKFTSYSLIEVTGGGTKELVTVNLNSNAEGEARNLNIYTYNKGKVKKYDAFFTIFFPLYL